MHRGRQQIMTSTFLNESEQVALQQALYSSELLPCNIKVTPTSLSTHRQDAYSLIAVMLFCCNLGKTKWPCFLKTAIAVATDECQWLTCELIRCQQEYTAQHSDAVIVEQCALLNGIFSEELAYIDEVLAAETQAD